EESIKQALREHRGNASVVSVGMNALLLYPDRPFGLGTLYGSEFNPDTGRRERFVIAEPEDLDEGILYEKERRLVEEIKSSLSRGGARGALARLRESRSSISPMRAQPRRRVYD